MTYKRKSGRGAPANLLGKTRSRPYVGSGSQPQYGPGSQQGFERYSSQIRLGTGIGGDLSPLGAMVLGMLLGSDTVRKLDGRQEDAGL
jgi:hypothetical protein